MHDDSDVIQASTPGNTRLPRLWANSKEMKTDTYSDRCSTTCRNDSTMSTAAQPLIHAHMCTTRTSSEVVTKVVTASGNGEIPTQKRVSVRSVDTALSGHLTGALTQGVFMSHPARAAAAPVPDANAHFPSIRRTGQQARVAPTRHRYHHHMTIPQGGQKTGHSGRRGAVSYSEIPLRTDAPTPSATSPSRNPAHHSRRLFDDSNALEGFVLISAHQFGYNGTYSNKRSWTDAFKNRSENRSEKCPRIGSW